MENIWKISKEYDYLDIGHNEDGIPIIIWGIDKHGNLYKKETHNATTLGHYEFFGPPSVSKFIFSGRFDVNKLRLGRIPILKLDFGFENSAVTGNLVSLIAPKPVPQLNQDLLRYNKQN